MISNDISEKSEPSTSNRLLKIASSDDRTELETVFQSVNKSIETTGSWSQGDETAGIYAHILAEIPVKKLTYSGKFFMK